MGGTAAMDARIQDDHKAQRDYANKMSLEQYAAQQRRITTEMEIDANRDIADQRTAIEYLRIQNTSRYYDILEQQMELAAESAGRDPNKPLTQGQKDALFEATIPVLEKMFPDLKDKNAQSWQTLPDKEKQGVARMYMDKLQTVVDDPKATQEAKQAAASMQSHIQGYLTIGFNPTATYADAAGWYEQMFKILEPLAPTATQTPPPPAGGAARDLSKYDLND
jgi:hypothetical protein